MVLSYGSVLFDRRPSSVLYRLYKCMLSSCLEYSCLLTVPDVVVINYSVDVVIVVATTPYNRDLL